MKLKNSLLIIILSVVIVAALGSCKKSHYVPRPDVEHLKNPINREITITLPTDARLASAQITYWIKNKECVPIDSTIALGGIRPTFQEKFYIELEQSTEGRIVGVIAESPIASKDYYGLGVCEWSLAILEVTAWSKPKIRVLIKEKDLLSTSEVTMPCTQWGGVRDQYATCLSDPPAKESRNPELFQVKFLSKIQGASQR
jgi:hypothetical protein